VELLFVCIENAGRSQMAEAIAERLGYEVKSAGTVPARSILPTVVTVMEEIGLDISKRKPEMLTNEMIEWWVDLTITVGCSIEGVCPAPILAELQRKFVEWKIDDPNGKSIEEVREIRDEI